MIILVLIFSACNEGDSPDSHAASLNNSANSSDDLVTVSVINTSGTSTDLSLYTVSSFSKHVYFHSTQDKILIAYDFFPTGSDICSQATYDEKTNPNGCQVDQTVVVPCDFSDAALEDDMLSFNMSVGDACEDDIVVDLSAAEFTTDGLVFDFSASLDAFDSDFEFKISKQGFVDGNDNAVLNFDSSDVALEDVYAEIIGKQMK